LCRCQRPETRKQSADGPRQTRLAHAIGRYGADPATAARQLDETDRARELYVRHFYKMDPHDPRLYHLVIDATAFGLDTCLDLIVRAARALPGAPGVLAG
jgi:cytidylate kinase